MPINQFIMVAALTHQNIEARIPSVLATPATHMLHATALCLNLLLFIKLPQVSGQRFSLSSAYFSRSCAEQMYRKCLRKMCGILFMYTLLKI